MLSLAVGNSTPLQSWTRSSYNTGLKLHKQEIIQNVYNQMDLNVNKIIIIFNINILFHQ